MAYPKSLRDQLGLSQAVFSSIIECSPGQLSMAESGKRELPTHSVIIIGQMEKAMLQVAKPDYKTIAADEKLLTYLEEYIESAQIDIKTMVLEAKIVKEKAKPIQKVLEMLESFGPQGLAANNSDSQLEIALLKRRKLAKLAQLQQEMVRRQIAVAGLEAAIATAEKFKQDWPTPLPDKIEPIE